MPQFDLLSMVGNQVVKDRHCSACALSDNASLKCNRMLGVGPQNVDLMFVGRSPASEDDRQGIPYTGKGGQIFHELLAEAGINKDSIFVTNCLKCCAFDTEIKEKFWEQCKHHLLMEIEQVKPKAIVAVGAEALWWLTGQSGLKKLRKHGIPCKIKKDILVFPLAQPAQLFHAQGPAKTRIRSEIIEDLKWLKQKGIEGSLGKSGDIETDYRMARSVKEVVEFLEELEDYDEISCDIETADKEFKGGQLFPNSKGVIAAIGFSSGPGMGRAIPLTALGLNTLYYWKDRELAKIRMHLGSFLRRKSFYGHNFLQFDQKWIRRDFGIDHLKISFDTQAAHYLLDEERGGHDLEALAVQFCKMIPWKKAFSVRNTEQLCEYLCKDVDATARLKDVLSEMLTPQFWWLLKELLMPLGHVLMEMEHLGTLASMEALNKLDAFLNDKEAKTMALMRSMDEVKAFEFDNNVTLNPDAPKHISAIMEKYLKLPRIEDTAGGEYSTNVRVLEAYAHVPFIKALTEYRGMTKLHGTYCRGMMESVEEDGRIHTSFMMHGTVTGRLASSDPNLLNMPRKETAGKTLDDGGLVKDIFIASPGMILVNADQGQAELRALAMYSKDPKLVKIFELDLDVHSATAAEVYAVPLDKVSKEQRQDAKPVNFGIIYGKTEEGIIGDFIEGAVDQWKKGKKYQGWTLQQVEREGVEKGKLFWKKHHEAFPWVWYYMDLQEYNIRQQGYQETLLGRRRRYEYVDDKAIRQAYNAPIQSLATDFTHFAIIRIHKRFKEEKINARLLLTVYDSILFEVQIDQMWQACKIAKWEMENIKTTMGFEFMNVPLKADMEAGYSWGKMVKLNIDKMTFENA